MAMTKTVAQVRLDRKLREAEGALDDALLRQCELLSEMILCRRGTGVGPSEGHVALLRLCKSQQALLGAGGELARVHEGLRQIQEQVLGIERCPPDTTVGSIKEEKLVS